MGNDCFFLFAKVGGNGNGKHRYKQIRIKKKIKFSRTSKRDNKYCVKQIKNNN